MLRIATLVLALTFPSTRATGVQSPPDGTFEAFYEDGSKEETGRYKDGLRSGKWRRWYPDGKREHLGSYKRGLRVKEWKYFDENGTLDERKSGTYGIETITRQDESVLGEGERKDGARHGDWRFWWAGDQLRAEGNYVAGRREGDWAFWHPDGTFDAGWISGVYRDGERIAPLPEPRENLADSGAMNRLSAVAELDPKLSDEERNAARRFVATLRTGSIEAGDEALAHLSSMGRLALPFLLAFLQDLDHSLPDDLALAKRVEMSYLIETFGHGNFSLGTDPSAGHEPYNRTATLRWISLAQIAEEMPTWRELDLRGFARLRREAGVEYARAHTLVELSPPFRGDKLYERKTEPDLEFFAPRFEEPRGRRKKGYKEQLDAALGWLARHQSSSGNWDADNFAGECGPEPCEGLGTPEHNVGLTGLALIALLGDGNTCERGEYREQVARGLQWLMEQQDQRSGLIGEKLSYAYMFNHAVATTALCEAACFSESAWLCESAEKAVAAGLKARNPYGAWRYDTLPKGEADTSVTGWMILALETARRAGVVGADQLREPLFGASAWCDEVTDPSTGRVGYQEVGSSSVRYVNLNDHYPAEKGEALTAEVLFCRLLLGQSVEDFPIVVRHADLLLRTLPEWDVEGRGCDMYYWFFGAHAMVNLGQDYWEPWSAAMRQAIETSQSTSGHATGSWDPAGPWGFAGGRVYSTAMMALCMEAEKRYAPLAPR